MFHLLNLIISLILSVYLIRCSIASISLFIRVYLLWAGWRGPKGAPYVI
nr:MAG TPA: hypothetical protein [Caudoviricetes sp.]